MEKVMNFLIKVEKDGEILEIHPNTLRAHLAAGWVERKTDKVEKVDVEKIEEPQNKSQPDQPKTVQSKTKK